MYDLNHHSTFFFFLVFSLGPVTNLGTWIFHLHFGKQIRFKPSFFYINMFLTS